MKLSEELVWRGFVNQTTLSDLSAVDNKKLSFYHGYDASADSLTIGNLAALMLDKLFIKHGHKAYLLAGGATSLVGDPGGKNSERPMQSVKAVEANVAAVRKQIDKLFGDSAELLNNLDWLKDLKVLDFLRDIGKHFSITPLVQRDYIAKRLGSGGSGISYAEFSYTILQGYDFLHLHQKYGIDLQLAGSDQWGNCLSGIELIRRVEGDEVNALTMPLVVNKATGKKFGKSEDGAIWLDPKKTDPVKEFFQYWLNLDDDGLESYLKIFTELSKPEIEAVMQDHNADKSKRIGQKKLAYEITCLVHGKAVAKSAMDYADSLATKPSASLKPTLKIKVTDFTSIVEAVVVSGLASSKTEANRLLQDGGLYINDVKVTREYFKPTDFTKGPIRLRKGKKLNNFVVIDIEKK